MGIIRVLPLSFSKLPLRNTVTNMNIFAPLIFELGRYNKYVKELISPHKFIMR